MKDPQTTKGAECNRDYRGGMLCRSNYPGDSACTESGGKMECLKKEKDKCQKKQ